VTQTRTLVETDTIDAESTIKPTSKRILTLDLLRGYFLLDMILIHLNYWPNGLDWVGFRGQLFVTSAEGFFLISGVVLGIVRGGKLRHQPMKEPTKLLLRRSLQLYVTYVAAQLAFTLIGWLFIDNPGLKNGIAPEGTPILPLIWQTMTFQYIYGWADYLRLYVVFLLFSPLAIGLLRKGKWWIVLGANLVIWTLAPRPDWPANIYLQPYHWCILFFGGLIIGFHWNTIRDWWLALQRPVRQWTIRILVAITVVVVAFNVFLAFGGLLGGDIYNFVAPLRASLAMTFDKENLPPARLIYALLVFAAGYWFFSRYERFIAKWFGWFLLPFGTNSLYVYTVQAFLVFFVALLLPSGSNDPLFGIVLTYSTLAIIWVMIRYKVLFKIIPR
jgi:hypothetical protein